MVAPGDERLKGLSRPDLWSLLWNMRLEGASLRLLKDAVSRWEALTGRRYYEGEKK
ncbi:MAG: hypothetical protein HUJ63_01440 [Enterococcus sp.]|nr:hypothetical protein [Enterococcus sp.]